MVLREVLDTPGATAALVTPDRDLAGRVAADLLRYGVVADDSAGEALADSPPAVFLRLLARAVAEELEPVPLLALLKHPAGSCGTGSGRLPRRRACNGARLSAGSAAAPVVWSGYAARSTGPAWSPTQEPCWRGWKLAWSRRFGSIPPSRWRRHWPSRH